MKFIKINKKELKYIIFAGLFALIWFSFLIPNIVENYNGNFMNFFLFGVGLIVFLQIFLKSLTLKTKISGSLGLVILIIAIDTITPPYAVDTSGTLLNGMNLYSSAPDFFFGSLAIHLGLQGILVYLFTYVATPIILLLIVAHLIPNFVRQI